MEDKNKHSYSNFWLNTNIQIIVAGGKTLTSEILEVLNNQTVYQLHTIHLSQLLQEQFIEGFVRTGSVYMISENTKLCNHNTVQLIPTGTLILHLTEATYKVLGIPGTASKQFNTKYVVAIDLLASSMKTGKNEHKRIERCLTVCPDLMFDFKITWVPKESSICPSSIANYFTREGVECFQCLHTCTTQRWKQAHVPVLNDKCIDRSEVFEWIGDVACEAELGRSCGQFEYECPEPSCVIDHLYFHSISNLIANEDIQQLILRLRTFVKEAKDVPWVTLTVDGCKEAPVLYKHFENTSDFIQDHIHSTIIFENGENWSDQCVTHGEKCL